ncbi:cation:proton antiporter [Paenibacillus helianthi]|uniref:Cation:proton antiporter n=1 Tax=Paenibacillus helianthi TaxID=1349432 RepID=A0ABX3EVE0_9BACL|nr:MULTISPECIES: Na(+)/H(+) antiporter subunit F1 [Paenibacillus]OKP66960.1 cation:proton antiporter [Paenibacillus sp. P3E]OKP90366.1 cation:proton antiporter [Paenibacillus sp. P32E]OKP90502.1 cation:proton antiporter [Paenibacillus helianthi]
MISVLLQLALIILALAMLACLYRLVQGPTRSDRIAALDTIGIHLLAVIAVLSIQQKTEDYIEIVLVIGILTFIGTTALARYIERDAVIEQGGDELDR